MSFMGKDLFPYIAVIQAGISVIYPLKNKTPLDKYEKDCYGFAVIILFLLSYFAFTTLTVSFVHTLPDETMAGMNIYIDWPFWAGNNIAFTNSFPADSFRQIGMPFKYHYFSSLLMAHISLCTLLDVNLVSFYLSPIFAGVIFILSAYYLTTRFIKNKWLIFGFMLGIVYTDGTIVTGTGGA